jgi:signal transduction histidine kinase
MSRAPLSLQEKLFHRSLLVVTGLSLASMALKAAFPSLQEADWATALFVLVFCGALGLVQIGRVRLSIWLVVGLGVSVLLAITLTQGGAESRFAAFLPMTAIAVWSWVGRRAGIAFVGLVLALLCAAGMGFVSGDPASDTEMLVSHAVSIVIGSALLGSITRDLRSVAMTAHARAEQAERSARAAKEAHEARDRFLEMVSHELRTPLDAVLGYAELLREEEEDPQRGRDLDRIYAAGRQLLSLVDDLLDMSRVIADDITLESQPVPLGPLVDEVVQTIEPMASAKDDRLIVQLDALPDELVSDRRRIRQILLNLASNSTKYTQGGEIKIEVGPAPDQGFVRLTVSDTGIGIPAQRLSDLFQPFVQLHEGTDRRPGIGLGLALSQRLAQRLGGRIEAHSVVGKGSAFALVLPLRR